MNTPLRWLKYNTFDFAFFFENLKNKENLPYNLTEYEQVQYPLTVIINDKPNLEIGIEYPITYDNIQNIFDDIQQQV